MRSRNTALVIASVILTAGVTLGLTSATSGETKQSETSFAGRYQATADNSRVYLIDTTTGECWRNGPDDKWQRVIPAVERIK
jgi:hypothetical protein